MFSAGKLELISERVVFHLSAVVEHKDVMTPHILARLSTRAFTDLHVDVLRRRCR